MLKYCLDILVTPITDIISISMDTSAYPKKCKEAHVRPLLKKTYLPKLTEKLHPTFISKILEMVVADWLQAHIKKISV